MHWERGKTRIHYKTVVVHFMPTAAKIEESTVPFELKPTIGEREALDSIGIGGTHPVVKRLPTAEGLRALE